MKYKRTLVCHLCSVFFFFFSFFLHSSILPSTFSPLFTSILLPHPSLPSFTFASIPTQKHKNDCHHHIRNYRHWPLLQQQTQDPALRLLCRLLKDRRLCLRSPVHRYPHRRPPPSRARLGQLSSLDPSHALPLGLLDLLL